MEENLKHTAVKAGFWAMVEQYSGQIIQFVISVILARLLTPAEYGLIGMLAIFMGISNVFIDGGFSSALIQRQDRSAADFSTVFIINVVMALLMYMILFISAPAIAAFYDQPQLVSIVRVYCFSLVIASFGATSAVQLTIKLDFKTTTKIALIAATLSGITGIILAFMGFGVWALVAQALTSAVITLLLRVFFVRWIPREGFNKQSFHKLFSFSSKLFAASMISAVYDNLTGAVIGKQFNSATLGLYTRAYSLNTLVNSNITTVLSRVSYPLLSKIQSEDEHLKSIYSKYIEMSAFLTMPALMLLCGIAEPLIYCLFGAKWLPCAIFAQILTFGMMADGIIASNLNLIRVKGRSDLILKLEIIKKSIAFTILFITIACDSIMAICIGKAIYGGIIALYLNTYYTKKLLNYGFKEQFKSFAPYMFLSFGVMGISLLICTLIGHSWLSLAAAVPVAAGFYLVCCKLLNTYAYRQFIGIIRHGK